MKLTTAIAACVVLAAVTGCESVRSDEDQIRAAYRDLGRAIADGDAKRVCELMTIEVREAIKAFAARTDARRSCPAFVRKNLRASLKSARKVSGDWLIEGDHDAEPRLAPADRPPIPKRP